MHVYIYVYIQYVYTYVNNAHVILIICSRASTCVTYSADTNTADGASNAAG